MTSKSLNVFGDVSKACSELAARDPALKLALDAIEAPLIRRRAKGFAGLFRIIVEQQVSVASAKAIWARVRAGVQPMSAKTVLALGEEKLKGLGLTRQKAHYVTCLAQSIRVRQINFTCLGELPNEEASALLQSVKGVGPWSAGIYLLFCEGRVDIWPPGDIALEHSYGYAAGLAAKPSSATLNEIADEWAPYRGLAAHILWTYYARVKGRKPI